MSEKNRKALEQFEQTRRQMAESQATLAIGEHALAVIESRGDVTLTGLLESLEAEARSNNEMTSTRARAAITALHFAQANAEDHG